MSFIAVVTFFFYEGCPDVFGSIDTNTDLRNGLIAGGLARAKKFTEQVETGATKRNSLQSISNLGPITYVRRTDEMTKHPISSSEE